MLAGLVVESARIRQVVAETDERVGREWHTDFGHCFPDLLASFDPDRSESDQEESAGGHACAG